MLFCMQYKDSHNVDEQRDRFQHAIKMQIQIVSVAGEDEGRVVGDAGFKTML